MISLGYMDTGVESRWGGITEEVWTPPLGDSIMGVFKLVVDGETKFYEMIAISEENETLVMRLKHFHGNLVGWEEKGESVDFELVKMEEKRAYFDGFTFEKAGPDIMNIYVVLGNAEGERNEVKFTYNKIR